MTSTTPPSGNPPGGPPTYSPTRDNRPVSFYVAIFLGLLLLVSGALNLVLLVVSAFGSMTSGIAGGGYSDGDDAFYEMVVVDGDRGARDTVLRVPIEGAIAEAGSPLLGAAGGMVSQVRRSLRAAARDSSIRAVLFDINSPGGGVTDSDEIYRLIRRFKEENPGTKVVALMGDIAASGGYYIAAACDLILARPTTITGSIGVIISGYNYGDALAKYGVYAVTIKSKDTPFKDMMSPTRPMTDVERAKIEAIVQEMYERFVDVVAAGRSEMTRDEVRAAATGEIYSASQALEIGLIDAIGASEDAYRMITEMLEIDSVRVVEQRRIPNLFDALFRSQATAPTAEQLLGRLLESTTGPRMLYYWQGGR